MQNKIDENAGGFSVRRSPAQPSVSQLVQSLIREHANPARLLELFYWSQESDVLAIIRALRPLPQAARGVLSSFFSMAGDPRAITVSVGPRGEVTFYSPQVEKTVVRVREATRRKAMRRVA